VRRAERAGGGIAATMLHNLTPEVPRVV
jgi:hypothetical protein